MSKTEVEVGKLVDTGLLSLCLIARFMGIATSTEQLRHQFIEPKQQADASDLLRIAKAVGLKAGLIKSEWSKLPKLALPAMLSLKSGRYLILAGVNPDKVLLQDPLEHAPKAMDRAGFEAMWDGQVLLLTKRANLRAEDRKFNISWFLPAVLKYRKPLIEVVVASFFLQLFALLTPLFFQVVIDKVLVHKALTTLHVLSIGLLALTLFEVVLGGLRTYLFAHTSNRIDVSLGAQLFNHLLRLPLTYFESRRVGDIVARVRELETIRQFITSSTLTLVIDIFFTLVFIAVLLLYSVELSLIVLVTIPIYVLLSVIVTPIFKKRLDEKFARGAENQAFLVEAVNGIGTLKAMAVEPAMQRRWEEQIAGYVKASFNTATLGNIASQIAAFINKLTTVAILWFGASLVMDGSLSIGQLIAFNMLAGRVTGPLLRLVQLWQDFQQARISIDRLGDVLNTVPEPTYSQHKSTLPSLAGGIEFDNVIFRYKIDGPPILKKLSLTITAGQVIGIVGRSGSGKSTLAKLIQRLYVPEAGRILIDGVDISQLDPAWLRKNIGVVLQENVLFNRTVRENIALADPGMALEAVIAAAKLAGAHDFIVEMTHGYDSMVGEHGTTLSGGQRQRIAIARALVTNPRILLFDEATSALDYESERIIQENLARICHGRTVIMIAHRLSTIRDAARILVLDNGEIVEQGAHVELIKSAGYYACLHKSHMGDPTPANYY
ncbi:MAG: type I secretion system permease/ATPase [Gammaproteobacteria bacterium]|nr:type I secretion system permease/ATPase [Gammaproteobacteria bacterium]